jgi:hypothetical protein
VNVLVTESGTIHSSVSDLNPGSPPNTNAAVCVPEPPAAVLATLKSPTSVQLVPSQASVNAELHLELLLLQLKLL